MENNKLSTKKVYTVCQLEVGHVLRIFLKKKRKNLSLNILINIILIKLRDWGNMDNCLVKTDISMFLSCFVFIPAHSLQVCFCSSFNLYLFLCHYFEIILKYRGFFCNSLIVYFHRQKLSQKETCEIKDLQLRS